MHNLRSGLPFRRCIKAQWSPSLKEQLMHPELRRAPFPVTLDRLQTDPSAWQYVSDPFCERTSDLAGLNECAFRTLDHFHAIPDTSREFSLGCAIFGTLSAVRVLARVNPIAGMTQARRLGRYFSSPNATCAFSTIREFELSPLRRYLIPVMAPLMTVSASSTQTVTPIEMTIRGLAFSMLYTLDPQCTRRPELDTARKECVHGLLAWGRPKHLTKVKSIMRYE